MQHRIDKRLKWWGSISQSRRHAEEFTQNKWYCNGCFGYFREARGLLVGSYQVVCGEYGHAVEERDSVLDMWQRIPIRSGHGVQSSNLHMGAILSWVLLRGEGGRPMRSVEIALWFLVASGAPFPHEQLFLFLQGNTSMRLWSRGHWFGCSWTLDVLAISS